MSIEIINSDAIVLRSIKHSETSRIINIYTELRGRISLLAKGARKTKHHIPFDTYSLINVVYRHKASREIQLLTGSEAHNLFLGIRDNLKKSSIAFYMCELILRTTEAEDANPRIFQTIKNSLDSLNRASKNYYNYLWYFEIKLLEAIGFGIDFDSCGSCGGKAELTGKEKSAFSFEHGGMICAKCKVDDEKSVVLRPETLKALQYIAKQQPDKLERISVSKDANVQINNVIAGYYRHHLEDMRGMKSRKLTAMVHG